MNEVLWLGFLALIWIFGAVVFFGAPFLPSLKKQSKAALDLLNLKPGQTILELGCGDGRVVKMAAEKGLKVVGYELNILLVFIARVRTLKYRKQATIIWGNYWNKAWPETDGIFTFLLPTFMEKLNNKIVHYSHKPVKLVSVSFKIPNKKVSAQKNNVYLYEYR